VVGIVMMLMGANSRTVSEDVHAKIESIQKTLPDGVYIDTFYNRTDLVNRTIHTVIKNLAEGGILVVLILLLLLGNLRGGLIVASAIPLSMLIALWCMQRMGLSGNLMSLGAIDFGLIVDGSVVMVENIVRYLHHNRSDTKTSHLEKVRSACHEVARPVVFAVGIIMIVYIPILGLRGIEGKMFGPMAYTVVFALAGSLLCALTLMPVLASLFMKKVSEKEPLLFRLSQRIYKPLLAFVLGRPKAIAASALLAFVGSLAFVPFMGAEFIPRLDEGAIALQVWRLPSVSLETSNEIETQVETVLKTFHEVDTVISRTGRPEIASDPMGVEISDTYIMLNPPETWSYDNKDALIAAMNERLVEAVPGVMFSYSQPIELRVAELISGVRSDIGIQIFAASGSLDDMKRVADRVAAVVRKIDGLEEVKAEQVTGLPTMSIHVDRSAIARLGLNAEDVLGVIEAVGGREAGTVIEGQRRFAVQVRFDPSVRADLQMIRTLPVALPSEDGQPAAWIPLDEVADIEIAVGPAQISREKIQRKITVEANVRGRALASAVAEAQAAVDANVEIPDGWQVEWGGQFENLEAASQRLSTLVPLALLLIFVLLYSTFNSSKLAILIFLNVPIATTGGILALVVRGYPFSISAGVGFIALFGVAVLNGVVLVSNIVQRRDEGSGVFEAARDAALTRLRPVLMTAMVASFGFIPMAFASSAGAEVQRPLATVVIGGLITSTLLTLLVVPTMYRWFARR
jgi:cobalt-zinc-cadmium resistance protein CzcA